MFYTIYVEDNKIRAGEKITFYANTEEGILLNEEQFNELAIKTATESFCEYDFFQWLDNNYDASDLYKETTEFFAELKQEYIEDQIENAKDEMFDDGWGKVEYTIE